MTVFITSDLHFGHSKIVEYCNRPTTIEDHTDWLINQMNSVISYEDDVYHVGDFAFLRRPEQIAEILKLLNGNWKFILGNHDVRRTLELACEMEGTGRHTVIGDYLRTKFDSVDVILFHFTIENWDKRTYGSLHLHGHLHGSKPELDIPNRFDVGIDCHPQHLPFTFKELKARMIPISNGRSASSRGQ